MTHRGYISQRVAVVAFLSLAVFKETERERKLRDYLRYDFGRWVALRERFATLVIIGPIVFGGRPLVGY